MTQHWNDSQISNNSYDIFKQWKNIPDAKMSINTSIRQQLLNTKTYRSQTLHEQVEELSCRLCSKQQESASHIAQSLYKTRYDKMLRPVYHALLENMDAMNLIIVLHGTCNLILSQAKILWDIPWQVEKCPQDGANKPEISILDKKNKEWSLVKGTIFTPGAIAERTKYKQNKYVDLRFGIKNLYPGYKVKLITMVFDYLGAYYKDLDKELTLLFGPKVARKVGN